MSSGMPYRLPLYIPPFHTVGAKSASVSSSAVATSSSGWMICRAAWVASWSMCMTAMSGPLPEDTAPGSLA